MGAYAYIQDKNNAQITVGVGPQAITLGQSELAVTYEGKSNFKTHSAPTLAIKKSIVVPEGFYAVLVNPSADENHQHPKANTRAAAPELRIGNKIVINGPDSFALWPGQEADVIRGHQLASDDYLFVRVYDAEAARANFDKLQFVAATKVPAVSSDEDPVIGGGKIGGADLSEDKSTLTADDLTVGKILVIKGTEVSFFVPTTGMAVIPEISVEGVTLKKNYIRKAVTVRAAEYCIKDNQNGSVKYVRGPAVVFPNPTETFRPDADGNVAIRAVELNDVQGIQVKVTARYEDKVLGRWVEQGEELFLKGDQFPIYFPREEHKIIMYDNNVKHFAVSVPEGNGYYTLDRGTGEVKLRRGPIMLLPDPSRETIINRILEDGEVKLWYPNSPDAQIYNRELRRIGNASPTTRSGMVSSGDLERSSARMGAAMASGLAMGIF